MKRLAILVLLGAVLALAGPAMATTVTLQGSLVNSCTLDSMTMNAQGNVTLSVSACKYSPPGPGGLALTLSKGTLLAGTIGQPYSDQVTMTASGGTAPYTLTCSIPSASGLTAAVNGTVCTIGGTPSAAGTYSASFTVTDTTSATATNQLSLTITPDTPPPPPPPAGVVDLVYGQFSHFVVGANGLKFFRVTVNTPCPATIVHPLVGQLRMKLTMQQGLPNVDIFVKKGTLPTLQEYRDKLAQTSYTPGPFTDGTFFWNFSTSPLEVIPVQRFYTQYPEFSQPGVYYILLYNTTTNQTSGDVSYYCN